MSIKSIVPSRDWVNTINKNFIDLAGSDTDWQHGIVGMNGFDASNIMYRTSTINVGGKSLRLVQVDGYATVPALKGDEKRVVMQVPELASHSNYYTSVGQISGTRFAFTEATDVDNGLMIIAPYPTDSFGAYLHYLAIYS